ncbi:MAG: HD domain-containing protein [Acidimicrobiia bacterium]|nr:HD domain-containing protein [Acidimicrobiia bacterium]
MTAGSIEEIHALYERWGAEHYDEELSQLAHALQTAALAERESAGDGLVAAALLHDVGHLLELQAGADATGPVDRRHERTGAAYLSEMFDDGVTAPISLHVQAKRYLCATDASYAGGLSAGSTRSLELQGGPMTAAECRDFEARPGFAEAVSLRRWDDLGKVDGLDVGTFDRHVPLLERARRGPCLPQ